MKRGQTVRRIIAAAGIALAALLGLLVARTALAPIRFHRAKDARAKAGSGFGLAIVRQAAEAHGGFVEASNPPGGGALLRIGFGPRLEFDEPAPESTVNVS